MWQPPGGLGHVVGIRGRSPPGWLHPCCWMALWGWAGHFGVCTSLPQQRRPTDLVGKRSSHGGDDNQELLLVAGELPVVRRGGWESPQPLLPGPRPASALGWFSGAQAFQEFVRN